MKQVIWINIAVGFWLVLAAFTQHSQLLSGLRMYNDLTVGVLVLLCALWYLGPMTTSVSDSPADELSPRAAIVATVVLGAWLIVAPFLIFYAPLNDVLCGIVIIVVALFAGVPAWGRSTV